MSKTKLDKNVYVPMRDGVKISVDVYRPDEPGKYPALVAIGSYGKELEAMTAWFPSQPRTGSLWDGDIETGDSVFLNSRGYAHVVADSRGSGFSEGLYKFHESDMNDVYDLINWVAQQPWSDGNVGTIGISMFGANSMIAACMAPEPLKAAWIQEFSTDPYRQIFYHGGILSLFFYGLYFGLAGDSGIALSAATRQRDENVPEDIRQQLKEIAESNPDIKYYPNIYHLCQYPEKNPFFIPALLNPYDGPHYTSWGPRGRWHNIKCPVYLVSNMESEIYTPAALEAWEKIKNVPKKLMLTPRGFLERPFYQWHDELLRWYDYHFKGVDNGIMDEPPVKVFISGTNEWRFENEWPLKRTKWTKWYLRIYRRLLPEPERLDDVPPDGFLSPPIMVNDDIATLNYRTPPMLHDTEMTGPLALYLYAKIDNDDTNWMLRLYDIAPWGEKTMLSRGYLKASHRALYEAESKPYAPYHPHTKESVKPVKPGEITEYAIAILPIAHVFKTGHCLELEIRNTESIKDPLFNDIWPCGYHLPISKTVAHWIYQDAKYQSHMYVPIIPRE